MAERDDALQPEVLFSRTMGELWFSEHFTVADIEGNRARIELVASPGIFEIRPSALDLHHSRVDYDL